MKKIATLVLSCICVMANANSDKNDYTSAKIEVYKQSAAALPAFIPLEIGAIRPQGWLKDWANTAVNGITGHIDEYIPVFQDGWKGFGFKARGVNEDGTGWPLEQCSYWLDGATKLAYMIQDTMLIRKTSERLNLVVNGVLAGGETFIYWKPKTIINDLFNSWGNGLMGRTLVSYYQATHDPKILQALVKVYRKYPINVDQDEFMRFNRGTTNIDAMTDTYLMSGEKAILDSIVGYSQKQITQSTVDKWNEINNNPLAAKDYNGVHGVSYYELLRVPAMMYSWTGDKRELQATENILKWGEKSSVLPLGVCSSEEYLAGIGSIRNIETCNVPTSMWSFLWMLRLTGDSRWSDRIEKVFMNAGSAPAARDFKTMCYYQSPNRVSNQLPEVVPVPGKGDLDFTNYGHEVLCCVGNLNNILPDYIGNMWMATLDGGLAATLYGPCRVSQKVKNADVQIDCVTNYPFRDKIEMKFSTSQEVTMPIYFRIPEWCHRFSIVVNNKKLLLKSKDGFVKVNRRWKNKDVIKIVLPMEVKVQQGRENSYPQIEYFLKEQSAAKNPTVNNPYQYVTYGPLLFSLPIPDVNNNQEDVTAKFNYMPTVTNNYTAQDVSVSFNPMPSKWMWKLEESPILLKVKAKEIDWRPTQLQPLPSSAVKGGKPTTITLVPYGCTKFRVSMFPISGNEGR